MADRRAPARGPRSAGRRPASRRPGRREADLVDSGPQTAIRSGAAPKRPRLTGRAGILALVLAVLVVSYASSARAYLAQRHDIDQLNQEIAQHQAAIGTLQGQVTRWKDPAYVAMQARERFGYVMPGETSYVALNADGKRIQPPARLGRPVDTTPPPTAWWKTVWGSVELAGDPAHPTRK